MSKQEVLSQIERLTNGHFPKIRSYSSQEQGLLYVDDIVSHGKHKLSVSDIGYAKGSLRETVEYFGRHLNKFLFADLIIYDGTSAIPYMYLLKSAMREYKKLHPDLVDTTPKTIFFDAHPFALERDKIITDHSPTSSKRKRQIKNFFKMIDGINSNAFPEIWQEGGEHVSEAMRLIKSMPGNSKIIIFDEFSDTKDLRYPAGSLKSLTYFLKKRFPMHKVQPISPRPEVNNLFIEPRHVLNPLQRVSEQSSSIRRPTIETIARSEGLQFIRECKEVGHMVAQIAA